MYIACATSVSENVGLLLKNVYMVSDNFDLLGNAFVPRCDAIAMNFGTQKKGGGSGPLDPPLDPPMIYCTICATNNGVFSTQSALSAFIAQQQDPVYLQDIDKVFFKWLLFIVQLCIFNNIDVAYIIYNYRRLTPDID